MKTTSPSSSSDCLPDSPRLPSPSEFPANADTRHWLAAALFLAVPAAMQAQTLIIDRQITGIVHHFTPPDPTFGIQVTSRTRSIDTAGLTNVDLDQYQTFKLRLSASAGQKVVASNADSYRSSLNLYYYAGVDTVPTARPQCLSSRTSPGPCQPGNTPFSTSAMTATC